MSNLVYSYEDCDKIIGFVEILMLSFQFKYVKLMKEFLNEY